MLKRKIIRTLLNYKAQMISMLLMIILGVGIFLGCNIEWYSIKTNRTNYYEDTGYPEYRIYKDSFSLDELQYVKDFSDVKYATRALTTLGSLNNNTYLMLNVLEDCQNIKPFYIDGGVYVCRRIKDDGYKINKEIDFNLYGSKEIISSKVIGVCLSMTEGIYMTENTANELGISYKIQTLYTNLNAMVDSNVSSITTKTELLSAFNTMMEMMDSMIWILILASAILAVVVLYNLASLGYIEKIREISTLKVIGFTNKKIAKILVVGTIWITVMGLIIGLPLGAYLLDILLRALAGEYEMNMAFGYLSYIVGIVVPFLVSLVTIYLISKKTKKLDMVSALKEREA